MSSDPPLSRVRLTLKQINPEDLSELGRAAMSACFTGFTEPLEEGSDYVRAGQRLALDRLGVLVESDLSSARRFAGDRSLGRGRYFTVCHDGTGNDGGTLVRELSAYHHPLKAGLVTVIDPTVPAHESMVPTGLRGLWTQLLFLFPPIGAHPHPFAGGYTTAAEPLYVSLPLRILETEVDDVVDLRRPDTAAWVARSLSRLDWASTLCDLGDLALTAFPNKEPLESFEQLLPSLFCQSLGGGRGPVQVAGVWLRRLGVNGVVFPSARSDSRVHLCDGELEDWSGFNFVDYRGADAPEIAMAVDFSPGWPAFVQTWPDDYTEDPDITVYETVNFAFSHEETHAGSWKVDGLEMRRAAPYCFLEAVWLLQQMFGADDPDVRNTIGLAYDFMNKTYRPELSRDLVNAIMGRPVPRQRILEFVATDALDRDPEIRASVQALLGQRLQAG